MEHRHDFRLGRHEDAGSEVPAGGIVECAVAMGISRRYRLRQPHRDGPYREAAPVDDGLPARRDDETWRGSVDFDQPSHALRPFGGKHAAHRDHETRTGSVAEI